MKFVPCLCWVPRGVASTMPHKVKVDQDEMQQLLDSRNVHESSEEVEEATLAEGDEKQKTAENSTNAEAVKTDVDAEYDLGKYDEEENTNSGLSVSNVACFATNSNDPYITETVESDDEDEDFKLKESDNLIILAKVDTDEYTLEVFVYDEDESAFYCHHDYILQTPALCCQSISFDVGADDRKGNLCAVGTMDPDIEIWDIDVLETIEPVGRLGESRTKKTSATHSKKQKKMCHTDSILDLAWNKNLDHILASASVDKTIIFWDLEETTGAQILSGHEDKVQTIEWHPTNSDLILSGACDSCVKLWDGRSGEESNNWKVDGEIEKVLWNHFDSDYFLCSTEKGQLHLFDCRSENIIDTVSCSDSPVTGLTLSPTIKNLLLTSSEDGYLRIYNIALNKIKLITEHKPKLGRLHCAQFSPDSAWSIAIGGEKSECIKVIDIRNFDNVNDVFGGDGGS